MIFGNPNDFAIEAHREVFNHPSVWGHMCVFVQGVRLGDIVDSFCQMDVTAAHLEDLLPDALDNLWDSLFEGRSDIEIFKILNAALYESGPNGTYEEVVTNWKRFWRFNFLTNWGEQFDGVSAVIIHRPNQGLRVLYRLYPEEEAVGVASCSVACAKEAISSFLSWIERENESPTPAA